ncbi:MAG: hypothetical protein AAF637_02590 [Pseudomonadota bacterium]
MAGIEINEEGDGVWKVTLPGVDIKKDLPDELEERCYELGLLVVGIDGSILHVSPRDDIEAPINAVLNDLRAYLDKVA